MSPENRGGVDPGREEVLWAGPHSLAKARSPFRDETVCGLGVSRARMVSGEAGKAEGELGRQQLRP